MTDSRSRTGRRTAAACAALALVVGGLTAQGAAAEPVYPSQEQVDAAQQAASSTAAQIGAVESRLAAATAGLEAAQHAAAVAAEDYNEAQVALETATRAAEQAKAAADQARVAVEDARVEIGRLAAGTYRTGTGLAGLEAFLSANGPQDLLDRTSALNSLGDRRQQTYQRMDATRTVARLLDEQARVAQQEQQEAAAAAEAARSAAAAAAAAAQAQVDAVAQTRAALVAELAQLRQTSVELEQQRQNGLEADRLARAEAAARAAAAEREARASSAAAQREASDRAAAERAVAPRASRDRPSGPAPAPAPAPAPPPGRSNGSSSGGQAALDWARSQIGKPYLWGGTGPDAYDCSGLTMRAWQQGGVNLPRTSREQYRRVQKIGYSQLRPGDLVFYGNGTDTSSIHHVAIYSGNGRMVEAPRAGVPLRETALRMSGTMEFAGRP